MSGKATKDTYVSPFETQIARSESSTEATLQKVLAWQKGDKTWIPVQEHYDAVIRGIQQSEQMLTIMHRGKHPTPGQDWHREIARVQAVQKKDNQIRAIYESAGFKPSASAPAAAKPAAAFGPGAPKTTSTAAPTHSVAAP